MSKLLIALLILPSIAFADSLYQYNDEVNITLTDSTCRIKQHEALFPKAAYATRQTDGDILNGCYVMQGDTYVIQWQDIEGYQSEITQLPANKFK